MRQHEARRSGSAPGLRASGVVALGAAVATGFAAALPLVWLFGFTVDDALVSGRVAWNIAHGLGHRFNRGGPVVDAVTPLGWAYVLAPFARSGPLAALYFAKYFGAALSVATMAWLGARTARESGGAVRLVVLVPLALGAPLAAWCGAGMETGVVVALATVAVGPSRFSLLVAGLAAAWRPELAPWSAALGVGRVVARSAREGTSLDAWRAGGAVATSLSPALAVAAVRLLAFGRPVPLAFFAKPSDLAHGAFYVLACLIWTGAPALVIAPWAVRRLDGDSRAILVAGAVHCGSLLVCGGDWMAFFRLFVPVLPGLFLVGARLVAVAPRWASTLRVLVAASVSALLLFTKGRAARGVLAERLALVARAEPLLRGAERVAALDVGWVGAATAADIVDLAGITDDGVAMLHGGHTSKRIPATFLKERHVDAAVLLANGLVSSGQPPAHVAWARAVEARVAREAAALGFTVKATLELPSEGQRYFVLTLQDGSE
ncbi:MAG TPA: hypothetical protein VHC69_13790 [Polyangiaceae bacterium]|nr:hypothetical protein [Polyangiaceae bacterium]